MSKWVVELEPGVYLAEGRGDPARTLRMGLAKVFTSHPRARHGLMSARKWRPFENARVTLAPLGEDQREGTR